MVCQSQTIDDSDAPLAKDLRALVRQKVIEGQTDDQIFDYLRSKYGDYILMKPRLKMNTFFLWFSPIVILIIVLPVNNETSNDFGFSNRYLTFSGIYTKDPSVNTAEFSAE